MIWNRLYIKFIDSKFINCRKCPLQLNKPKHSWLKLSINKSCNIWRFPQFKGEIDYDTELIIYNSYDKQCKTPRDESVYEHCNPKFLSETHNNSSKWMNELPKGEFIKTIILNPITGNIILFAIIPPPIGQEFD